MLPPHLEEAYLRCCEHIDKDRLSDLLAMLVETPSPTGEEGDLARRIVGHLHGVGIAAEEQRLTAAQSNAVGTLGDGAGRCLLLYAPIDTVTSNAADEDVPWAGEELRPDMRAAPWREGDIVFGLGAQNPKGHAACILAAAEALKAAGVPLAGTLRLGFGAGGMPSDSRPGQPADTGHGHGCMMMMQSAPRPDAAVIAKTGWFVSWEEVGLAWYEVRVKGTHTYVGSRHLLPYTNAIRQAGRLVERLEDWFEAWAQSHRSGLVEPQGVVAFIEGGTERTAAFTPAECRIRFDLRLSPGTTFQEADAEVSDFLAETGRELGIDLSFRRLVAIPGTTTDPDEPVIRDSIAAWEALMHRDHQPVPGLSGATDANILRGFGIPTARIGLPKAPIEGIDFQLGMNAAFLPDMERLTKLLVRVALTTCGS